MAKKKEEKKGSSWWKWALGLGALGGAGYLIYKWWESQQQQGVPLLGGGGGGAPPPSTQPSGAEKIVEVFIGQIPASQAPAGVVSFAKNAVQNFVNTYQKSKAIQKAAEETGHKNLAVTAANYATYLKNLANATQNMMQSNISPVAKLANLQIAETSVGAVSNFLNQGLAAAVKQPSTPVPVVTRGMYTIYRGTYSTQAPSSTQVVQELAKKEQRGAGLRVMYR